MKRICKKCNIEKDFETEFPKTGKCFCKECVSIKRKEFYQKNKDRINEQKKKSQKEYALKNQERLKEYAKQYRLNNKEKIKEASQLHYINNKERLKPIRSKWRQDNKEKTSGYYKKFKTTPYGKLLKNIFSLIRCVLRHKYPNTITSSTITLGWTQDDFTSRNGIRGENQQVDHKIPLSWFVIECPINISCSLENLQLLTKEQNKEKNNFYHDEVSEEYKELIKPYIKEEFKNKIYEYKEQVDN